MKATLIIEGKEIEIEISEEEYKKLQPPKEKKTGYERVLPDNEFYYAASRGCIESGVDAYDYIDNEYYESANYYSSPIVADNNIRADNLMRQIRRFAVEHRTHEVDIDDININKYYIIYDYEDSILSTSYAIYSKFFGVIYFDSRETAQAAIDEFHDELIWYFTEYKDSL